MALDPANSFQRNDLGFSGLKRAQGTGERGPDFRQALAREIARAVTANTDVSRSRSGMLEKRSCKRAA